MAEAKGDIVAWIDLFESQDVCGQEAMQKS